MTEEARWKERAVMLTAPLQKLKENPAKGEKEESHPDMSKTSSQSWFNARGTPPPRGSPRAGLTSTFPMPKEISKVTYKAP